MTKYDIKLQALMQAQIFHQVQSPTKNINQLVKSAEKIYKFLNDEKNIEINPKAKIAFINPKK